MESLLNSQTQPGKYSDSVVSMSSSNSQNISARSVDESPLGASVNELIEGALEQQRGWNETLGEKMESMRSDIAHLKGALILPRQTSTMQQPKEPKETKKVQEPRHYQPEAKAHAIHDFSKQPERESVEKVLDQVSAMVAKIEDEKKKGQLKDVEKNKRESSVECAPFTPLVASRQSSQECLSMTDYRTPCYSAARGSSPERMVSSGSSVAVPGHASSSVKDNSRVGQTTNIPEPGLNMFLSQLQGNVMISPRCGHRVAHTPNVPSSRGTFPTQRMSLSPGACLRSTPCINPPKNSQPMRKLVTSEPLPSHLNSGAHSPRLRRSNSRRGLESAQLPINPNVVRQPSIQLKNSVSLPSGASSPRPPMVVPPAIASRKSNSPTTLTSGRASPRHSLGVASSIGNAGKQRRFVGIPTVTWTYYEVPEFA